MPPMPHGPRTACVTLFWPCPPALGRAIGDMLVSRPGLRAALVRWPTPAALRAAGKARVRTLIAKRSARTAQATTDAIWAALRAQTVTVVAEAAWGETIGDLTADLDRTITRRQQLEADIKAAFLYHPLGKVLNSMCGFGPRTGARTLAEIGDPHRFANPGRLAAYAGLAPVDRQSGRSHRTRRPRGGNHRLKNAMFHAAFVATQHDPDAPRLLPTQNSPRQRTQRSSHLRRQTPMQRHPGHAQDPNPLPAPPTRETARRGLTTRQGPTTDTVVSTSINNSPSRLSSVAARRPNPSRPRTATSKELSLPAICGLFTQLAFNPLGVVRPQTKTKHLHHPPITATPCSNAKSSQTHPHPTIPRSLPIRGEPEIR